MANIEENSQNAAAPVITEGEDITPNNNRVVTDVVQNFIPTQWLVPSLHDAWKYATVIKQVFIMQAGATVKLRRTMDAGQRNLDALMQYNAWCENVKICYPRAAIIKYLQYTTKTLRKTYSGRDVYRKFADGLEKFQNVFTPLWNQVLASGISGKTYQEIWLKFVGRLIQSADAVSAENLPGIEFKQQWLLPYKFLGPPCPKLYPGRTCHELFSEANLQAQRGTGSRKRRSEKLSRRDEREDFARRTKIALLSARKEKAAKKGKQDNFLVMNTVMRGVELMSESRKSEFDMIARALQLYGAEDPRAAKLKDAMFELLQNRKTMKEQIQEVQGHFKATIDLTQEEAAAEPVCEDIDPLHIREDIEIPDLVPTPISIDDDEQNAAPASGPPVTQVSCMYECIHRLFVQTVCLFAFTAHCRSQV